VPSNSEEPESTIANIVKKNSELLNSMGVMLAVSGVATVLPLKRLGAVISAISLVITAMILGSFHNQIPPYRHRVLSQVFWLRFLLEVLFLTFIIYIALAYIELIEGFYPLIMMSVLAAAYFRFFHKRVRSVFDCGGKLVKTIISIVSLVLLLGGYVLTSSIAGRYSKEIAWFVNKARAELSRPAGN
jgi:hypothetical protein